MGASSIEWTDETWNPVTGCTKVSPGCAHCYAERMSKRLAGRFGYPADEPFRVTVHPDRLDEPRGWRKPRRVFVCSMSDLFHPDVPDEFIGDVLHVAAENPRHTFQFLTKRPERMRDVLVELEQRDGFYGHGNLWFGVTAEDQQRADERIPVLLQIPAAVRFVSLEPLLGEIDLEPETHHSDCKSRVGDTCDCDGGCDNAPPGEKWLERLDWVIVGGETGPGARPMHPDWVRSIRDQCVAAGVPFFFKSWGAWAQAGAMGEFCFNPGASVHDLVTMNRIGKKHAGRTLDGRVWNQFPEAAKAADIAR